MTDKPDTESGLLRRVREGDEDALIVLFARHRDRLKRMVRVRLDSRIPGRLDASDVLQEALLRPTGGPPNTPPARHPAYLWLRLLIRGAAAVPPHRHHLGTKMRDAGMEVSLHRGAPAGESVSLAKLLLGRLTSPTRAAQRAEIRVRLEEVLNRMDATDREVLVLRHFEELSNAEGPRSWA